MVNYKPEDLVDHHGTSAIIKEGNKILMQKHVKYGFWTIPVGKTDADESPEQSLLRELEEECGIRATKFKEIADDKIVYHREEKKVHVHYHAYLIEKYTGTIINKEPHKHTEQVFLDIEKVKTLPYLSDATLLYLRHLGFVREERI